MSKICQVRLVLAKFMQYAIYKYVRRDTNEVCVYPPKPIDTAGGLVYTDFQRRKAPKRNAETEVWGMMLISLNVIGLSFTCRRHGVYCAL